MILNPTLTTSKPIIPPLQHRGIQLSSSTIPMVYNEALQGKKLNVLPSRGIPSTPITIPTLSTIIRPPAHTPATTLTSPSKGINALRLLNAGLGVAGGLSYATAKRPVWPGVGRYESVIHPAMGMSEASKRFALGQIASQTLSASQPLSADNRMNALSKLGANYQANQAITQLAVQDNDLYRQDMQRVTQQQNQDRLFNFENQQRNNEQKFALEKEQTDQRRTLGLNMMQQALNYEVQRNADQTNKAILEKQANQRLATMAETQIIQRNTQRRIQGLPPLTPEEEQAIRQQYNTHATAQYVRPSGLLR